MPNIELNNFIDSVLKNIQTQVGENFIIQGPIDFELSVITTQNKEGKIDVRVLELDSEVSTQNIQKLRFSIYSKGDVNLKKILAEAKLTAEENQRRWSIGYKPGPVK